MKRGCESSNCGLCTVFMDDKPSAFPVLSWRPGPTATGSTPWRGSRRAEEFGAFIADQGSETVRLLQSGHGHERHCHVQENPDPTDDEIREYLAGNPCAAAPATRDSPGIRAFIEYKKEEERHEECKSRDP